MAVGEDDDADVFILLTLRVVIGDNDDDDEQEDDDTGEIRKFHQRALASCLLSESRQPTTASIARELSSTPLEILPVGSSTVTW